MGIQPSTVDDYIQLEKLKKSLPQKLVHIAEKKKCKNIYQLGLAIKQSRDKTIQSHKSRIDIFKPNRNNKTKKTKKLKLNTSLNSNNIEYTNKIMTKAKNLKIIQ